MALTPAEINSKLVVPAEDSFTPVKESEALFMYELIKKHALKRTLETGFGYARSASHIISATESKHIGMDPFQKHYGNGGLENIKRLGLEHLMEFHGDYSHNVLPKIHAEGKTFQFIFIDGDHKFDGEFVDYYYADLLLEQNGYMLLHDTWMRSTALVMKWIEKNRKDYRKIPTGLRNVAMYQKIGEDKRGWMYFSEFYTFKSVFVHPIIEWLNEGEMTAAKRFVLKMKALLR